MDNPGNKVVQPTSTTQDQIEQHPEQIIQAFLQRQDNGFTLPQQPDVETSETIEQDGKLLRIRRLGYKFTSQRWLEGEAAGVDFPLWQHRLTLYIPESQTAVSHSGHIIFYIDGGTLHPIAGTPAQPGSDALNFQSIAARTGLIIVHLQDIPNQYFSFRKDNAKATKEGKVSPGGAHGFYKEDDLIAWSWRRFISNPDTYTSVPLQLPMLKAAVKAMDVTQTLLARHNLPSADKFIVSGLSKRGWITWLTAAFDPRVAAIMPGVIDVLNTVPSMQHQFMAYAGHWAPAVASYRSMLQLLEPGRELSPQQKIERQNLELLLHLVDPFTYKNRITQPKLILSASSDDFFLPDSWQFFLKELKGPTYTQVLPNNPHYIVRENAATVTDSLTAFATYIATGTPLPELNWQLVDGKLVVTTTQRPDHILFWQAESPDIRDFRINRGSEAPVRYIARHIDATCQGISCKYTFDISLPDKGWGAFFTEFSFKDKSLPPLLLTTPVSVRPESYPPVR
ncbi:PhoPQ-activated protein PqaA family protein [Endozoicomonadaceae bacterium StTr2]